ncbi:Nucleotide-binding universal stress protein, UspA family [Geoalkalibacter ferrihydriticus]|uniref:Universal stress protein UspA n=2 Tax=Geoalkalibacter ferrihydriticus TaxID=392333 RepID=A0A0C2EGP0_9BACT|nr:universal stress protein [Geoalkalibacter ferrihydriticus]KIH77813.1 universal stress protein UspA [Geoalkalibacter ferrihydriticus DSM 17813]SDL80546.1 Nucleotide-binding universal stress protein, UspA family [Geoalkalibacter ferrihydriticus]
MEIKILLPLDDGETSRRTVEFVLANRERFSVPLTLLHVVNIDKLAYRMIPDFQMSMVKERAQAAGEQLLHKLMEPFLAAGLRVTPRLEVGNPREVIPRIADGENFQLLVIGRSHMGEIRDVLFGAVANYVVHRVKCPVLLV